MTLKVGIIGLGAIGNYLIDRVLESEKVELSAVCDIEKLQYDKLSKRLSSPPPRVELSEFPVDTDIFIECASTAAVKPVIEEGLKRAKTVIVASIGGLQGQEELWDFINSSNGKLILPSGAIGGLDILKAIPNEDLEEVSLTTRKHPRSLPDLDMNGKEEITVFEGTAQDAVKRFPKNINVAAMLSIAGLGFEKTKVKILADVNVKYNTHEIQIVSKSGRYHLTCENYPFETNPASSKLSAQSIWAAVQSVDCKVIKGL